MVAPDTIVTSSPAPGTTPPTHEVPTFQSPPVAVEVMAAIADFSFKTSSFAGSATASGGGSMASSSTKIRCRAVPVLPKISVTW